MLPDREDNNVKYNDQHISIDPQFWAELDSRQEGNISEFLRLPELIPEKEKKATTFIGLHPKLNFNFERLYQRPSRGFGKKRGGSSCCKEKKRR